MEYNFSIAASQGKVHGIEIPGIILYSDPKSRVSVGSHIPYQLPINLIESIFGR